MNIILLLIFGLIAGVLSSVLGIGGGFLTVPILFLIVKAPMHTAVGTSLAIIVPTALTGALCHMHSGNVNYRYFIIISLSAIVGSIFGAHIVNYVNDQILRKIFAILFMIIAIRMFIK